jgi:hypothetical protein
MTYRIQDSKIQIHHYEQLWKVALLLFISHGILVEVQCQYFDLLKPTDDFMYRQD